MATDLSKLMGEISDQGVMDSLSGVVEADPSRDDSDARSADVDPLAIGLYTHAHEIGGRQDADAETSAAVERTAQEKPIDSPHAGLQGGRVAKGMIEAGKAGDLVGGAFDEMLADGEFNLESQRDSAAYER